MKEVAVLKFSDGQMLELLVPDLKEEILIPLAPPWPLACTTDRSTRLATKRFVFSHAVYVEVP